MFADAPATEGPAKNRGEVLKQPEGREVGVKRNNKDSASNRLFLQELQPSQMD